MKYIAEGITIDEDLCNGQPTIRGKRITVKTILGLLSVGESTENILENYPTINEMDIKNCLDYATMLVENETLTKTVA